ncbi:MAG: hypothetical protein WBL28_09955 [Methylotenera sp.]
MTNAPRRPGRPPGNKSLRELRSMTWYYAVLAREGRNDCQLDILFGTDKDEVPRSSADRIKIFEAIRANKSIPTDGTKGKRNFDLVARVDSHPNYAGTAAIIHSPFWRLLEDRQMPLNEVREIVVECIRRLGLTFEKGDYEDDGRNDLDDLVANNPEVSIQEYFRYRSEGDDGYDNAMAGTFMHLNPSLDYIALLGALAFEAIEAGNMLIAADQAKFFQIILKELCGQQWLNKVGVPLYQYAVNRMLDVLNADALKGLPDYSSMLSKIPDANLGSPAAAFLKRHQRLLWRR